MLHGESLPFLDIGDKPVTYVPTKSESEQIYVSNKSAFPKLLAVRYSDLVPRFNIADLKKHYDQSGLSEHNIDYDVLRDSVLLAKFVAKVAIVALSAWPTTGKASTPRGSA